MKKKLVAIGDSVVWGQGNTRKKTFAARVCRLLDDVDPQPIMVAHSGACIHPRRTVTASYGEVPLDSPGIREQIPEAMKRAGDVDDVRYVLLNGGINDVPVSNIVADPDGKLAKHIDDAFACFPELLTDVAKAFPKATVVALGYYPIVSEQTPETLKLKALLHFGPPDIAASVGRELENNDGDESRALLAFDDDLHEMAKRWKLFVDSANGKIEAAVDHSGLPAVFAKPDWRPEYSLNVSGKTHLWLGTNDSVFGQRLLRFLGHVIGFHFDWPLETILASFGHPNVAGSKDYATAIVKALKRSNDFRKTRAS